MVAGPQIKLLRRLVIFVDDAAIGSRQIDGAGDDGFQHGFKIEAGAHRLADFAQRFHFLDRLHQLARAFLQFLEQSDVLDGDDGLVGEGLEERDLLVSERSNLRSANQDSSNGNTFAEQRRGKNRPSTETVLSEALTSA